MEEDQRITRVKELVGACPDFPKPGILFRCGPSERVRVHVCVCVCARERERECVCVRERGASLYCVWYSLSEVTSPDAIETREVHIMVGYALPIISLPIQ